MGRRHSKPIAFCCRLALAEAKGWWLVLLGMIVHVMNHVKCEAVATSEPLCLAETTSAILVGQMDQRIHLARSVDNETETSGLKSENHIA